MTSPDSLNGLLLIAFVVTIGYSASCAAFPYKACRACHGVGAFRSSLLGAIRLCRRCNGSGLTLRAGRRFYNAAVKAYRRNRYLNQRRQDRRRDRDDD